MPEHIDIDEGERLHKKATPGEWRVSMSLPIGIAILDDANLVVAKGLSYMNAQSIVWNHNHFPDLAEELRQRRRELDEWQKWLVEHEARESARHEEIMALARQARDNNKKIEIAIQQLIKDRDEACADVQALLKRAVRHSEGWYTCQHCWNRWGFNQEEAHLPNCPIPDIRSRYPTEKNNG